MVIITILLLAKTCTRGKEVNLMTHHREGGKLVVRKGSATPGQALSANRKRMAQQRQIESAAANGMSLEEHKQAQQRASANLVTGWSLLRQARYHH